MATLRGIQKNVFSTNAPGGTNHFTWPFPVADQTKCILLPSRNCGVPSSSSWMYPSWVDNQNFDINGGGPGGGITVNFVSYLAEFLDGVSVQSGVTTWTSPSTQDITISAVDLSKTFVIAYETTVSGSVDGNNAVSAELTSTTNLRLFTQATTAAKSCFWQVVTYTGCTVQSGTTVLSGAGTSTTQATSAVTLANSVLFFSQDTVSDASAGVWCSASLTSTTQITFTRKTGGYTSNFKWFVVSFTDGTIVQHGTTLLNAITTNQAVTAVNLTYAVPHLVSNSHMHGVTAAGITSDCTSIELTTTTNLAFVRQNAASSVTPNWDVISFLGTPTGATVPVYRHAGR